MELPRYLPYKKEFPHAYAPGVTLSVYLLERMPQACRAFLLAQAGLENQGVRKIIDRCGELGVPCAVQDKAIRRLWPKDNCYCVGVFDKPQRALDPAAPHVVLVNPSDMGNLGTIERTCLGFGVRNVAVIRPGADCYDPKAVRASMGAVFALNIAYYDDFAAYRAAFPGRELFPFMLDGSEAMERVGPGEVPYSLIFGNESSGLPADFAAVGRPVRIDHGADIDSLNLSIAVGIGVYHFTRRKADAKGA